MLFANQLKINQLKIRLAKRYELSRNFTAGGLAPIGVLIYICDLTAILSSTEEATQLKSPGCLFS